MPEPRRGLVPMGSPNTGPLLKYGSKAGAKLTAEALPVATGIEESVAAARGDVVYGMAHGRPAGAELTFSVRTT